MITVARPNATEREPAKELQFLMKKWHAPLDREIINEIWILPSVMLHWGPDRAAPRKREIDLLVLGALPGSKRVHKRNSTRSCFESLCLTVEVKDIPMDSRRGENVIVRRNDSGTENATKQARQHAFALKDYLKTSEYFEEQSEAAPPPFVSGALWMKRDFCGALPNHMAVGGKDGDWGDFLTQVHNNRRNMEKTGRGPVKSESGVWRFGSNQGTVQSADSVRLIGEEMFDVHFSHYNWLGVGKGASEDNIDRARRRRIKQVHPDRSTSSVGGKLRNKLAKRVNQAYEVLTDPAQREKYDRQLSKRRSAKNKRRSSGNRSSRSSSRSQRTSSRGSSSRGSSSTGSRSSARSSAGTSSRKSTGPGSKSSRSKDSRSETYSAGGSSASSHTVDHSGPRGTASPQTWWKRSKRTCRRSVRLLWLPFHYAWVAIYAVWRFLRWIERGVDRVAEAAFTAVGIAVYAVVETFKILLKVAAFLVVLSILVRWVGAEVSEIGTALWNQLPSSPLQKKVAVVEVTANVRAKPSLEGEVLATARKGDTLEIRKTGQEGWIPIRHEEKAGFVSEKLLSRQAITPRYLRSVRNFFSGTSSPARAEE